MRGTLGVSGPMLEPVANFIQAAYWWVYCRLAEQPIVERAVWPHCVIVYLPSLD